MVESRVMFPVVSVKSSEEDETSVVFFPAVRVITFWFDSQCRHRNLQEFHT